MLTRLTLSARTHRCSFYQMLRPQMLASLHGSAVLPEQRGTCRRRCSDAPAAVVTCGHAAFSAANAAWALTPPCLIRSGEGRSPGSQTRASLGHGGPDACTAAGSWPPLPARQLAPRMRSARGPQAPSAAAHDAAPARDSAVAAVASGDAVDVRGTTDLSDQVPRAVAAVHLRYRLE